MFYFFDLATSGILVFPLIVLYFILLNISTLKGQKEILIFLKSIIGFNFLALQLLMQFGELFLAVLVIQGLVITPASLGTIYFFTNFNFNDDKNAAYWLGLKKKQLITLTLIAAICIAVSFTGISYKNKELLNYHLNLMVAMDTNENPETFITYNFRNPGSFLPFIPHIRDLLSSTNSHISISLDGRRTIIVYGKSVTGKFIYTRSQDSWILLDGSILPPCPRF